MKALLDTNIITHMGTNKFINSDIGYLFKWLDKLKIEKCIYPFTITEINKYKDSNTVNTLNVKIESNSQLNHQHKVISCCC